MIINTGGRTDTVNYYSDWLLNRFREGYVYARNPMFPKHIVRYRLTPDVVASAPSDTAITCRIVSTSSTARPSSRMRRALNSFTLSPADRATSTGFSTRGDGNHINMPHTTTAAAATPTAVAFAAQEWTHPVIRKGTLRHRPVAVSVEIKWVAHLV